jgi:serine/threonine-protein kinase
MLDIRVGSYRIIERLAKGGMGEVYLARHEIMNREAAVKVLHPEFGDKPELVERFLNEARAAATIRHPGIVEIYDVGHVDGRAYIVMEYLRGEPLASRLARTRIDVDKALLLTRQLAGALGAAHACGIIHRDLKPDNIFVVPDPDVLGGERTKILDFGIAKLIETKGAVHTMQGAMFGTPAYMAPEQCEDAGQVDRRADLYSLGCIVYELLCGKPPFGHGGIELVAAHLRDQPQPLRRRVPSIPASLEAVVMRLLAKKAEDRYQTCEALVRALDEVQAEQGGLPSLALTGPDAASARASASRDSSAGLAGTSVQRGPVASARGSTSELAHADTAAPGQLDGAVAAAGQARPSHGGPAQGPTYGAISLTPAEVAGPVMLATPTVASRTRWPSWLVAGVALLAVAAAGVWVLRPAPVVAPIAVDAAVSPVDANANAPDAGLDVRVLLERAQDAYDRKDWDAVRTLTREILRRADQGSEPWQDARELRQRVRGEEQYAASFAGFQQALAEGKILAAVEHYNALARDSMSRSEATEVWETWEAEQLKAAEQHARAGQCTQIEEIEAQMRRAAMEVAIAVEPIEKLRKRCVQRRHNDRDRDPPGSGGQEPGGQEPGGQEPGGQPGGGTQEPGGQEPGGQEPGGGTQEPGGQPGGQEPGGQQPGGGTQEPGGQPGGQEPGGQEPGGQTPGGQEPGGQEPGGQEPGGPEPGGETQVLRLAGARLTLAGENGKLPRLVERRLGQRLAACAREGDVRGQFAIRVEVGDGGRIDSVTAEPAQEALERCLRAMAGQRSAARPGSYRGTVQLP